MKTLKALSGLAIIAWLSGGTWIWAVLPPLVSPYVRRSNDVFVATYLYWYLIGPGVLVLALAASVLVGVFVCYVTEWAFGPISLPTLSKHKKTLAHIKELEQWHKEN